MKIEIRPIEVLELAVASLPQGAVCFLEGQHVHACYCCGELLKDRCVCELDRQPTFCDGCYAAMCEEWERGYDDLRSSEGGK